MLRFDAQPTTIAASVARTCRRSTLGSPTITGYTVYRGWRRPRWVGLADWPDRLGARGSRSTRREAGGRDAGGCGLGHRPFGRGSVPCRCARRIHRGLERHLLVAPLVRDAVDSKTGGGNEILPATRRPIPSVHDHSHLSRCQRLQGTARSRFRATVRQPSYHYEINRNTLRHRAAILLV